MFKWFSTIFSLGAPVKYVELSPCKEGPFVRYIEVIFHGFNYFWGGEYRCVAIHIFAMLMPHCI